MVTQQLLVRRECRSVDLYGAWIQGKTDRREYFQLLHHRTCRGYNGCNPADSTSSTSNRCWPQSSAISLYTDIQPAALFCNIYTSSKGYRGQYQPSIYLVPEFIMLIGFIQTANGPSFLNKHTITTCQSRLFTNDVILALM